MRRSVPASLSERYVQTCSLNHATHAPQVLRLRDELELKVDVLSLPVDICVQHALQGNSALQGALNVALRVLQDIEDYEAGLRQQEIDIVCALLLLPVCT